MVEGVGTVRCTDIPRWFLLLLLLLLLSSSSSSFSSFFFFLLSSSSSSFSLSRLQLAQSREESFKTIRAHEQQLEVARKELKLAQKEAAQRVAKFSEHGRAMAGDIERLTAKQVELVSHLEQREAELKDSTTNNKALHAKINDVKALRSEVANDLKQVTLLVMSWGVGEWGSGVLR